MCKVRNERNLLPTKYQALMKVYAFLSTALTPKPYLLKIQIFAWKFIWICIKLFYSSSWNFPFFISINGSTFFLFTLLFKTLYFVYVIFELGSI